MTQTIKSSRPRLHVYLIALAAVAAMLVPATSAPQKADAASAAVVRYWDKTPRYDAVLLARIGLYQLTMTDNVGFCEATGMSVMDHVKYDHRRWFARAFRGSKFDLSIREETRKPGGFSHCRWTDSESLQTSISGLTTAWFDMMRKSWLRDVRRGLIRARCELGWSALTFGYGKIAPFLADQLRYNAGARQIIGQTASEVLSYVSWCD